MAFRENQIIEKLNANNYSTWKFKVEMILIKEDLYSVITDNTPDPITDDWRKRDNKARAIINLFIEDSEIINIKHLETARETFETLKKIHERKNLSSKLFLLRKLYNTKLEEQGNMIIHISNILEIVDKLNAIGEKISDNHISALLLCSLPKSYDTLLTALEARPEHELVSEFIRSKLIDEYNKRIDQNRTYENSSKAFQINKNYRQTYDNNAHNYKPKTNFGNNSQKRENKFCSYCKKRSHYKSECWHLKKKANYTNNKTGNNASSLCLEIKSSESAENYTKNTRNITNTANDFAFITEPNVNKWVIDSGSSSHIANDIKLFTKFHDKINTDLVIANGQILKSYGSGDIKLTVKVSETEVNNITLQNVLYVPDIKSNLLSVKKATENGCTVVFDNNNCSFLHAGRTCLTGQINNNLYEIIFDNPAPIVHANIVSDCDSENCILKWHKRLGHRHYDSIKEMVNKQLATGVKLNKCKHTLICEVCTRSKMADKPYPKQAQHRANKILDLIHSDLCGPVKTPTIGGKTYLLTFIDDHSRYTTIYLVSHKSEVFEKFKEYVNLVKNKFGRTPGALRSDNAREYLSVEMENYMKSNGIKRQLSVPYCSPQNGVAERKNRSLIEMTRCLLNEANLDHKFWGEAVNTAVYLQNRLPTKSNVKTPFEMWENYKPDLSHIRLFGCKAYAYINKQKRTKLEDTAEPGIFVGYDSNSKGYRIYNGGKNITISRQVKFIEDITTDKNFKNEDNLNFQNDNTNDDLIINNEIEIDLSTPPSNVRTNTTDTNNKQPRRSQRTNIGVPPDRLIYLTEQNYVEEPKSWNDIQNIKNPIEKRNWLNAATEEINSLNQNETWTLVDPPKNKTIIGCKWTFKSKTNSEGNIENYKARLVAKGFSQKFGEDYDETFAPVVSHTTIRALLATAALKQLDVTHVDVKTAFLHGNLTEELYMEQPEGYVIPGSESKVCKLKKAIYGLKQAARAWQLKIENTLKNLNFVQSTADSCLYIRKIGKDITYIVVYVDDMLIVGSKTDIKNTIQNLREEYEIKDLGQITHYLGINIRKTDEGNYALNQRLKIQEIIKTFNLSDAKPCDTPMETNYLKLNNEEKFLPNNKNYRKAIGALLYIATITRPDVLAAVSILSRRCEKPREIDWTQVKRVIRYLKTTQYLELIIDPSPNAQLTCYSDSDWAGDTSDRKSTSGNLFFLGKSAICWNSKKQSMVAMSSAEAEYISAARATQELQWLLKLLDDLDMPQQLPIKMFEDNQSSIKMVECPKFSSRTKHVDIKFHRIRDLKSKGIIDMHYCPTTKMTADILTKPVPKPQFVKHRNNLQLQEFRGINVQESSGPVGNKSNSNDSFHVTSDRQLDEVLSTSNNIKT